MANFTKSRIIYQLSFGGAWPTSVAFVGNHRVAAGNQLGHIYLWEIPDKVPASAKIGKDRSAPNLDPARRFDGHSNEISRLAATPDGRWLISASYDHSVRLWTMDGPLSGQADAILEAAGNRRDIGKPVKGDTTIKVPVQSACDLLTGHVDWVYALGLSGDGLRAITGDAASQVIVWDLQTRQAVQKWKGLGWTWIVSASLNANGDTALVSEYLPRRDDFDCPAPAFKLWDVSTAKEKLDILKVQFPKMDPSQHSYASMQVWKRFVADGLIATAISPDGRIIAAGQGGETDTGQVHLIDATTGKLLRTVSGHRYGVTDVLFTADSQYVISAGRDTQARVCRITDGKEIAVLHSPRGGQFKDWLTSLSLSPDQKRLAATDVAGIVHIWEFE